MSESICVERLRESERESYVRLAHGFLKSPTHVGIQDCEEFVQQTWNNAQNLFQDKNTVLLVAKDSSQLVGYLAANIHPALHVNGNECMLRELYVDTPYRRRGIGALLVCTLEGLARERDCKRISLATNWGSDVQRGFYVSLGFDRRCDFVVKRI